MGQRNARDNNRIMRPEQFITHTLAYLDTGQVVPMTPIRHRILGTTNSFRGPRHVAMLGVFN